MMQISDAWFKAWLDTLGYELNAYVEPIIRCVEEEKPRFLCIYGGERSGKSFGTVAIAGKYLPPNSYPEKRMYWIVGPDYQSTRSEFQYLYDTYNKLGLIVDASMPESPTSRWAMELSTNERWETRTSADIRKLASFSIWGCLIVEANSQVPDVWLKIRGRLAEKRGWCVISGTYENSSEWFVDLYEKWSTPNREAARSFSLPTWANSRAFPKGEEDEEILELKASMPKEWFDERYAGIPSKPSNLVIPEFDWATHVGNYELDPTLPVELAIDPAKHTYAIAFIQKRGDVAVVLDAIYKHGWIAQSIIPSAMQHPLWPYVKLNVGYHGAIDVAGFAEPGTISQAQLWRDIAKVELYGQKYPEHETIYAVRYALAMGRLKFANLGNESSNGLAIEPLAEFRLWRNRPITDLGPVGQPIDKNNDFIKALGYWWLWRFGQVDKQPRGQMRRERGSGLSEAGRYTGNHLGAGRRPNSLREKRRSIRERLASNPLDTGRAQVGLGVGARTGYNRDAP